MKKNHKHVPYVGFGHVVFPYDSPGWLNSKYGICTVRVLTVDLYLKDTSTNDALLDMSFDDVLIGSDIHDTPADCFDFMQANASHITSSYLLGNMNWVGMATESEKTFWICTYDDLSPEGQAIYNAVKDANIGKQVLLLTAICRDAASIKQLTLETQRNKLPKLDYLLS